jgi:hypothetical protein
MNPKGVRPMFSRGGGEVETATLLFALSPTQVVICTVLPWLLSHYIHTDYISVLVWQAFVSKTPLAGALYRRLAHHGSAATDKFRHSTYKARLYSDIARLRTQSHFIFSLS